ncbi:MAG: DNA-deoxyinosine glycosylase [Clostridium sp.]
MSHENHGIQPVFDENSRVLILGSFPSVKSRESHFFYGHPQNRFWKVLSGVVEDVLPTTINEKKQFLLKHHIAIWDVIESCDIEGSSDSSIKNVVPNDLNQVLNHSSICQIFTNGNTSSRLYEKYCLEETKKAAIKLPSTSPANAAFSPERLIENWLQIKPYL